jgi:hypothetical protein
MAYGSCLFVVPLVVALIGPAAALAVAGPTGTTVRVNVTSEGVYPRWHGGAFERVVVTGGGRYVAFSSTEILDGGDSVGIDVYVRDTALGTTERVSVRSDGSALPDSSVLGMSPDGDRVVFAVGEGEPYRIFVRVRSSATTSLLVGNVCAGHSMAPDAAVSADGGWLAFVRCGVPAQMVLRRLTTGADIVVANLEDYSGWVLPSVADTGTLGFSTSQRLVVEDTDDGWDAYVYEPVSDTLSLATPFGTALDMGNGAIVLTPDASVFVFWANEAFWRWERGPDAPTRVGDAFVNEWLPEVSATVTPDGRFVTWMTAFSGSDPGAGVYLFDAQAPSAIERVDVDDFGRADDTEISAYPSIDPGGRYVAFTSDANLVGGDFSGSDVFLRDREGVPAVSALPDVMVRQHRRERWIGAGEIVPPWAARHGMPYSMPQTTGDVDRLSVRVRNRSPFAGSVSMTGPGSSVGCAVRYFHDGLDVTKLVVAGGFRSAALTPGASETLVMQIRDAPGGPASRRLKLVVSAVDAPTWVDSLIVNAC